MSPDEWLRENAGAPEKIDLGLERCKQVLSLCDLEVLPYQVFTVAGTNGKGSTVAILDSILSSAGLLTGRYSSPHLVRFNERILTGQIEQSNASILKAFIFIKKNAGAIPLSYFEYATLAGLVIFAWQGVDVALLEVGLGGRLDACNSVDADVSAITSIALDHQDWLGDDVESIGLEKAGIMRARKPCVLASSNLPKSISKHADAIDAQLIQLDEDYFFTSEKESWIWRDHKTKLKLHRPSLPGAIQLQNSAAAIAMIRHSQFRSITSKQIDTGLKRVKLTGRIQEFDFLERKWLLDVAHNPASVKVLCDFLEQSDHLGLVCVFSMLSDKDADTCVKLLRPFVKKWYLSELESPRALSRVELKGLLIKNDIHEDDIVFNSSVSEACRSAVNEVLPDDTILVCGSFYTVGAALEFFDSNQL